MFPAGDPDLLSSVCVYLVEHGGPRRGGWRPGGRDEGGVWKVRQSGEVRHFWGEVHKALSLTPCCWSSQMGWSQTPSSPVRSQMFQMMKLSGFSWSLRGWNQPSKVSVSLSSRCKTRFKQMNRSYVNLSIHQLFYTNHLWDLFCYFKAK